MVPNFSVYPYICPNFEQINISRATPLLLNQLTWQNLPEVGIRRKEPKLCMQYWIKPWRSIPRPLIRQARMRLRAQTAICDWRRKNIKITKGIFNLGLSPWEAQVIKIMFSLKKSRLQISINYTQPRNTTPPFSPREDARASFLTKHFYEIGKKYCVTNVLLL